MKYSSLDIAATRAKLQQQRCRWTTTKLSQFHLAIVENWIHFCGARSIFLFLPYFFNFELQQKKACKYNKK